MDTEKERLNDNIPDKVLLRYAINDLKKARQRIVELEAMNEYLSNEVKELEDKLYNNKSKPYHLSRGQKEEIAKSYYEKTLGMSLSKYKKELNNLKKSNSELISKLIKYENK